MAREQAPENLYYGLRNQALEVSASQLGINVSDEQPFGVVMETGYPEATVTLLSLAEGTTSLYFSNGGGIIGGGEYSAVRAAGMKFVATAALYVSHMEKAAIYPLPEIGEVRFYLLTPLGVFTHQVSENDLGHKRNLLWPLFYSGQAVMTEMRLMDEARQAR